MTKRLRVLPGPLEKVNSLFLQTKKFFFQTLGKNAMIYQKKIKKHRMIAMTSDFQKDRFTLKILYTSFQNK